MRFLWSVRYIEGMAANEYAVSTDCALTRKERRMVSRCKRLPTTLAEDEQNALLTQPNSRYPTGERNYLLIRLMLATGVRLAEAASPEWTHIDLATGKIMIIEGKGAKDRVLWVSESLLQASAALEKETSRVVQDYITECLLNC